ncbi:restriction endonuclease subunit S [Enterococcus faecalis]|uniref:restriction endonuclease subunit S n=1 Tax=Enterococcus faecalis TaxID=1351 RepID=UPI0024A612F1|nr:restriction endonuclease subunit S [Enterococcus faecalis]
MAKIDDSVKKKVPELRFKGFTDEWEQRKLSNESTITAGGDVDKSKLKEVGEYPIFANALTNDGTVGYYDSYYRVEAPAVTVTGRGDVGHAKARKVNFTPVVRLLAVKSNHDVDFLENAINNHKVLVESTGVPQLTAPQLGNYKIFFPTGEEEQKIGSFFKQLDKTIALHQHKLDLLKEQKKGYLQKMFPKNGAKVPELRFAGFADDWEERKLKDVTERVRSNDGRLDLPTLTMSASSGWLDQKDRFSGDISGKEKKNYTLLKKGELSYNHGNSKLAKYGVVFSLTNYEEALVPRVYHSFKALENTSADFIEYMFSTKLPDRELGKLVSSGARMDGLLNINYDDFMNIHISIPNYEEQILMSAFFRKLDENIALHQRKLDLLKEQKKGFLQTMFAK